MKKAPVLQLPAPSLDRELFLRRAIANFANRTTATVQRLTPSAAFMPASASGHVPLLFCRHQVFALQAD